jgi:amino acid adenylation domain-containing protein
MNLMPIDDVLPAVAPAAPMVNGVSPLRPGVEFVPFRLEDLEQAISHRFEQQVRQHPNRLAIDALGRKLTYAALNSLANRMARAIVACGGSEAEPVLLLMDKGAALIAAMLAILKAGKFYVPLSSSYPAARNALIANDARARLVITDTANAPTARQLAANAEVINADDLGPYLDDANLDIAVGPDHYAYIIYTSGSTGQPKGVVDTHRNLLQNIRRYTNSHYLSSADRLICVNACAFSNSLKDIYGALLNGGSVFPVDIPRDGLAAVTEVMAHKNITVLNAVATVYRNFVAALRPGDAFPHLRIIRVGSEAVSRKDVDLFRQHFPGPCVLVNGYGTTETGTIRVNIVHHDTDIQDSTLPIGYPVDGTDVLLLDDDGQPIEECGRIGQIAARSAYLSPGYWNRPDLTAAAFRPDPEGSERRVYMTGDLGMLRSDGCMVYAGRKDFQVKVRGNRIEIAEIELALMDSPLVSNATVIARNDQPENQELLAYVVPRPGLECPPDIAELRRWLKGRLPDCAIPASFVLLETLPVTPTGKIDRNALPAPAHVRPELGTLCMPPRNATEAQLVQLWADLLGVSTVGVRDNFFDLGGNSLMAARLFLQIAQQFGKQLPLSVLLQEATIEHLARLITGAAPAPQRSCLVAMQPRGDKPPFFCVHGIGGETLSFERLVKHLGPDQPFYGIQAADLRDDAAAERTIETIAARYVDELLELQPAGPYFLGGYSCGAAIAYEMAQQLRAKGHEVALLVLIDQRRPNVDPAFAWSLRGMVNFLRNIPAWLRDDFLAAGPRALWSRLRVKAGMLQRRLRAALRREPAPATQATDVFEMTHVPETFRQLLEVHYRALRAYAPRPYSGRVALLKARAQPLLRWHEPQMGWSTLLTGPTDVATLPGTHDSMLAEPNVGALAHALSERLDRAAALVRVHNGAAPRTCQYVNAG